MPAEVSPAGLAVLAVLTALTSAGCTPSWDRDGTGWEAACPVHGGNRRNLRVTGLDHDAALLACRKRCGDERVLDSLGLPAELAITSRIGDETLPETVEAEVVLHNWWRWVHRGFAVCWVETGIRWRRLSVRGRREISGSMTCSTWGCPTHRGPDVALILMLARRRFAAASALWVAQVGGVDEKERDRIYQMRRNRKARAVAISRDDGTTWWFGTGDLSGGHWPDRGSWLSQADAFEQLRRALELPGLSRTVSWSGAWRTGTAHDDDQPDSDATVELRPFGTRKWDEVWHRVREAASERWGVEVSPDYIPDELDLDEFIVLMHQIEDQVAAEGHIAEYEADDVDAEPEAVTETTCEVTEGVTESTRTKEICGIGDSSDSPAQPMETVEGRDHATSVTASDDVLSVTASGPDSLEEALRDEPLLDRLHDAIEAAVQEKDEPSDERDRSNSANPTGGADGS